MRRIAGASRKRPALSGRDAAATGLEIMAIAFAAALLSQVFLAGSPGPAKRIAVLPARRHGVPKVDLGHGGMAERRRD
jgi:hypothetical protein